MTFNEITLAERAEVTADLLVEAFTDAELLESVWSSYETICKEALFKFGVQPRKLGQDDRTHLSFELLCFSVFLVMGQEVPKFIVRRRLLLGSAPDDEGIRYFNGKLLEHLESHFVRQGATSVREVIVTAITPNMQFGLGEPLNCAKRIASYVHSGSSLKAADRFAQHIAYAVDPKNYVALKMLGMAYVEQIVDLTRGVLSSVFAGK
jgi:hypothetical protein